MARVWAERVRARKGGESVWREWPILLIERDFGGLEGAGGGEGRLVGDEGG